MKPRVTLAETTLPDGGPLSLQEHDGRLSLISHGQQLCGPGTMHVEMETARLACAPFRPVRQPKLWFLGLGLGHAVAAASAELKQKRGQFLVAEPLSDLVAWHRDLIPDSPLKHESRIDFETDPGPEGLAKHRGTLHAIIVHLDVSPLAPNRKPWPDDPRWLTQAFDALQAGGLLAIGGSRENAAMKRKLHRSGFHVAESEVIASPLARRPRLVPIWLARKPGGPS